MSDPHLKNDEFFMRLAELFEARRKTDHGSVFLTQKRLCFGEIAGFDSEPVIGGQLRHLPSSKPSQIIIRATNGKSNGKKHNKVKFSTVVESDVLEGFFMRYAEICKLGMSGLKKRDRSKGKKKTKSKKKKSGPLTGLEDPKRL